MELKVKEIDGVTYAEVQDGKPVFMDGDKELALDVPDMASKISRLNHEAMSKRKDIEALQEQVKAFEGIDDPKAAMKAIEAVKNMDSGKLLDAEKAAADRKAAVEAAIKEYVERAEKAESVANEATGALRKKTIGYELANSKFIKEQMARAPWEVERLFGDRIDIEGDKVIGRFQDGSPIYSKSTPGELAGLDEALEILVSQSPNRDEMLRGRQHSGSGAPGGGAQFSAKEMPRSEFNKLSAKERAAKMAESGFTVLD